MAELHTTKRVRDLAGVMRAAAGEQGADLPDDGYVERLIADRVQVVAQRLGVTIRTVLDRYLGEEQVRAWGTDLAVQLRDAELAAHDAAPVVVEQSDGLLVLAAFGVCGALAIRNMQRRHECDPLIVLKDAADSTTEIAVGLYRAGSAPAQIGGLAVVVGRKVLAMTAEALRKGWWDCTCGQPHRDDGGCGLQDRFAQDLALLGGWINNAEDVD